MDLFNLPKSKGINRKRKRKGIGVGSGHGKTAGRGTKGQKARKSGGIPLAFEGGQMPLARKLPYKRGRGFTNVKFKIRYAVVNLDDLNSLDIDTITRETLVIAGLIRSSELLVKILGNGVINKAVKVQVHSISDTAKSKIIAAGGSVELLNNNNQD